MNESRARGWETDSGPGTKRNQRKVQRVERANQRVRIEDNSPRQILLDVKKHWVEPLSAA